MNEQELLDLKKEIEESKENLSRLEGKKEQLMEQLQKNYGVKTAEAAQKKIKTMEKDIADWDKKIEQVTAKLEEHFESDTDTQE